MKFQDIEVQGRKIEVSIINDSGEFFATVDGETIKAKDLPALRAKLVGALKSRVEPIPCTIVGRDYDNEKAVSFRDGAIVGIHSGNGNVLFRPDDRVGGSEQIYPSRGFHHRLSDKEREEYRKLVAAKKTAEANVAAWLKKREIDVKAMLAKTGGVSS